jgi:hypothetical protein
MNGRDLAMSVDINVSNDVCTFCRHAQWHDEPKGFLGIPAPLCALGHTPYFRSMSNLGPIWVSDCGAGELRPELAAMEKT